MKIADISFPIPFNHSMDVHIAFSTAKPPRSPEHFNSFKMQHLPRYLLDSSNENILFDIQSTFFSPFPAQFHFKPNYF